MECFLGSRFLSVVLNFDLFSAVLLAVLLVMAAWLIAALFLLLLELGAFSAELSEFSVAMRDARQFSSLSSYESNPAIGVVLKAVAREFFVGALSGAFFSIRVDDAQQAKRLQQSFQLVRDDIVHRFCARIEWAHPLGKATVLLGICAALIMVAMAVLQCAPGEFGALRTDGQIVGVLLFGFLGAWCSLITVVMGSILQTKLTLLHHEFKRLAARVVLQVEKK